MGIGRSKASRHTSDKAEPKVHSKVFEDNAGAIEIAQMYPR
jgi:hypothetical protein